ncbi:hypothetical protein PSECIP111951_02673 [Pseudoalteromonas holothuriae]|uniref:Uncharacterized protein n=1 Tax=Pseudoalteromonas holothuriae TaxID=2963714 RepID=A0ABM9GKF9_9GAMM|nr:hypothetical protein [Pseudoalteromonas sp. CIP111951]CAH9062357.1 hypothetical protein PSECIP111951_02673 [Pseudoalteromonas sp. CIP111951]
MAKSKWTDSASVNEVLSRVEKLKLKAGQQCGQIITKKSFKSAFNSNGFDNYLMLLKELVRFDSEVPDAVKEQILHDAIWHAADMEQLQSGFIGGQIKRLEAEYLAQITKKYYLITAVSITGLKNKRMIKTPKSVITISKHFPKKFKNSYDFQQVQSMYPRINQKCYSWVTIEVCAKCVHAATEIALEQLDYWRGIFNIFLIITILELRLRSLLLSTKSPNIHITHFIWKMAIKHLPFISLTQTLAMKLHHWMFLKVMIKLSLFIKNYLLILISVEVESFSLKY